MIPKKKEMNKSFVGVSKETVVKNVYFNLDTIGKKTFDVLDISLTFRHSGGLKIPNNPYYF